MRVLHLSTLYPPHIVGGAERSVEMLAEAQVAAGHEVTAVCLSPNEAQHEIRGGVNVFRLPHGNNFWMEDWPRHSPRAREWAKFKQQFNHGIEARFGEVIDRMRPDLVHTHSLVDVSTLVWNAAARRGVPIVHTLRDFDLLCAASSMFRESGPCNHRHLKCSVLTMAKGWHQRRVTAVGAVGQDVLARHLQYGFFSHVPTDRQRVIWNTATVKGIDPAAPRPERDGPIVFGYLGRLSPEKGVDTLLAAARLLPRSGWRLLVAGSAMNDGAHYHALAEGLPVEFMGFAAPADLLRQIDVLVAPSLWAEPLGRTVLEAYQAGVPAIGSAHGGIAEIIADPEWLVPPGDVDALARRMLAVITRGRTGPPAGRARVLARTTPEAVAEAYDDLYDATLAAARASAA